MYYICVFGATTATYKLTVKNEMHDVYLKSGLSESGYVDANSTKLYYFRDEILAVEGESIEF